MPRKKEGYIWVDKVGYVKASRKQWNSLTPEQRELYVDTRKTAKQFRKQQLAEEKESRTAKRVARGRRWHFSPKSGKHGLWIDGKGLEPPREPLRVNPDQPAFNDHFEQRKIENQYFMRMVEPKRRAIAYNGAWNVPGYKYRTGKHWVDDEES
jgi:hypothetical protein